MTTPAPEPASGAALAGAATAVAVAQAHQAAAGLLVDATLSAVLAVWSRVDPNSWFDSWWRQRLGQQVFVLLSLAQESAASEAAPYVDAILRVLGTPMDVPRLRPSAFAGLASDGTSLESLLALAPVIAYARTQRGWTPERAQAAGGNFLRQVVSTQIQDAGRAADQVAIAASSPPGTGAGALFPNPYPSVAVALPPNQQQPADVGGLQPGAPGTVPASKGFRARGRASRYNYRAQVGYVRMLTPPSCPRCVVLAGKVYRWNEGFLRHPMCDCRHLPVVVADGESLTADPMRYFDSLTRAEQDDAFGRANAAAIRDGADISRVVNAAASGNTWTADDGRRYTKAGIARGRRGKKKGVGPVLRPTPNQIYRDARGNRDEAVRLLREFGYILA